MINENGKFLYINIDSLGLLGPFRKFTIYKSLFVNLQNHLMQNNADTELLKMNQQQLLMQLLQVLESLLLVPAFVRMSTKGQKWFNMLDVPRCHSIEEEQEGGSELTPEGESKPKECCKCP